MTGHQASCCTPYRWVVMPSSKTTIRPWRGHAVTVGKTLDRAGSAMTVPSQPLIFTRLDIRHLLFVRVPAGAESLRSVRSRRHARVDIDHNRCHVLAYLPPGDAPTEDDIRGVRHTGATD